MSRTIIIIVLIGLAFWALRRLLHHRTTSVPRSAEPPFEKTVRCAQCGVHVSTRLALERDGRHYCCPEHLPQ